jgi:hypothetical protein
MDPSLKGKSTENGTFMLGVCPKSWLPNQENGKREISLWFRPGEIHSYKTVHDLADSL